MRAGLPGGVRPAGKQTSGFCDSRIARERIVRNLPADMTRRRDRPNRRRSCRVHRRRLLSTRREARPPSGGDRAVRRVREVLVLGAAGEFGVDEMVGDTGPATTRPVLLVTRHI